MQPHSLIVILLQFSESATENLQIVCIFSAILKKKEYPCCEKHFITECIAYQFEEKRE